MIRLFVGLTLPEEVRRALAGLRRPMSGTRWVAPENLHLTLRFFGEATLDMASAIDEVLVELDAESFDLEIRSVGQFGTARSVKVLWAGVAPEPALVRLAAKIDRAVQRVGAAPREGHFHPHITLARLKYPPADRVADFLGAEIGLSVAPFPVESFSLFSSTLAPDGAVYRQEADYRLSVFDDLTLQSGEGSG